MLVLWVFGNKSERLTSCPDEGINVLCDGGVKADHPILLCVILAWIRGGEGCYLLKALLSTLHVTLTLMMFLEHVLTSLYNLYNSIHLEKRKVKFSMKQLLRPGACQHSSWTSHKVKV